MTAREFKAIEGDRSGLDAIEEAQRMVSDLCHQRRRWIMTIPADPERDPDLVISRGLRAGSRSIKALNDAVECVALAYGDYCEANPDPDQLPEPWVEIAQELLGAERSCEIFHRRSCDDR